MNLFIDTNVLLSFYHYTNEELEELEKLIVLLEQGKVVLFLPSQARQEFRRNREVKIADALKLFQQQKVGSPFPRFSHDYPEYEQIRAAQKKYDELHSALLAKLEADIQGKTLKADKIIAQLFKLAKGVPCDDDVFQKAERRIKCGNPPGKDGKLGDALNWEALLKEVPEKDGPFYFISGDKDYCSPLDENVFNGYLHAEWGERKKSKLHFYRRLSAFFKEHFPNIKFAAQLEVDLVIELLVASGNFNTTHLAIAKLSKHESFTAAQVETMAVAALINTQIGWILDDPDVHGFYSALLKKYADKLPAHIAEALTEGLKPKEKPAPSDDDSDIPF